MYITRNLVIAISCIIFLPIIAFIIYKIVKNRNQGINQKKICLVIILILILTLIIQEDITNILPINFKKVEDVFYYNFDKNKNKIVYKKEYNNTAFIYAKEKSWVPNEYTDRLSCYYKKANSWKLLLTEKNNYYNLVRIRPYDISYCTNNVNDATIIMITTLNIKELFNKDTKIVDSYGNEFDYIKDKSGKPVLSDIVNSYTYLSTINKKIDNNYYIKINDEKIYVLDN